METADYKVLLVDDEPDVLEFMTYNLHSAGYKVYSTQNGKEAIQKAKDIKPHLILLDVMMPEMDGVETCEQLRNQPELQSTIIAFLTARGEDYSQIAGFEAGGDDYITKPVKPKVLVSKIKALLKRTKTDPESQGKSLSDHQIVSGDLIIDKERYLIILKGEEVFFPRKEFELLSLLISKPEKVFSREEIFDRIWGENIVVGDRTIDVHIRKLREKLGDKYIKTVKGIGYKYVR